MNWNCVTIPATIILPLIILYALLCLWDIKGKHGPPVFVEFISLPFLIIGITISFTLAVMLPCKVRYTGEFSSSESGKIISLENVSSVNGEISGSAFGFNGSSQNGIDCVFIIENVNGIEIISMETSKVIFHSLNEGEPYAEKRHEIYTYPFQYHHC